MERKRVRRGSFSSVRWGFRKIIRNLIKTAIYPQRINAGDNTNDRNKKYERKLFPAKSLQAK